jgi:hypothetical protein
MHIMRTHKKSNFPDPPSFETVVKKLKKLLDIIQEALAEGTLHVSEYSHWQAESIDPALAPNLVRHKAKQFLISQGQEAEDEDDGDRAEFEMKQIPNNGLCTVAPGFRIRILKSADDGSVPPPGVSLTRLNFYNQGQALLDFAEFRNGNDTVEPVWGLIVHWSVNEKYCLQRLSIALPVHAARNDTGKLLVECAFDEPFWIKPTASVTAIAVDPPVTNQDISDVQIDESGDKTGEEPQAE